jgi:hypothetical protein
VIGTAWGVGEGADGAEKFRIPDLRGQFLRGWSGAIANDPDKDSRIPGYPGGASGNNVGSFQLDALQNFISRFYSRNIRPDCSSGIDISQGGCGSAPGAGGEAQAIFQVLMSPNIAGARTSSETRPRNASVLYIIKY